MGEMDRRSTSARSRQQQQDRQDRAADRPSARQARPGPPQGPDQAKKIAMIVIGTLTLVFIVLLALKLGGAWDAPPPPPPKVVDKNIDLDEARKLCKDASKKFHESDKRASTDRTGAMAGIKEAIDMVAKALEKYDKLSQEHEGEQYDYLSAEIEKAVEEMKVYRDRLKELKR